MKIEKILIALVIALSVLLCISIYIDRCRIAQNKSNEANLKAYIALNDTLKSTNRMFEFKTSQLNYINDSLVNQMNTIRKNIGVKDKNLKGLGYIKSTVRIHDTVLVNKIRDGDKTLSIDTVINKRWYQIEIDYKGSRCSECKDTLIVSPKVSSEKYVVISTSKEYVDAPKKWWLQRIFQKKEEVVDVKVVETNPYIYSDHERFIKVIK
jgi:hypothetical protein